MSRRSVVAAAAWSVPAVSLASATPAFANTSQATNLTIAGPSSGVPASGAVPMTVTVKDAQGQPQAGQPVSFSGPDGSSSDAADGVTNGAGQYTANFNLNKPWSKPGATISVTAVSGSGNASQSFTVLGSNVLGWGSGTFGVTGLGSVANTSSPSQLMQVFPSPVVQVAQGGDYFTLFRLADGTVWGVGRNGQGQLADGTTNDVYWPPQRVPGLSSVVDVAAGYQTGYAVLQDGTVRSWGVNANSALGDGTTYSAKSYSTSVVTVQGVSGAVKVAGGSWFGLALLSNGTVAGWGRNGFGQLGDTTDGDRATATTAVGVSGVTAIAATSVAGYALRGDGTIMAWGGNWKGQQGDGANTSGNRYTPAAVSGISTATSIAAAGQTGYALLADKTVVAWGDGEAGELGNGASAASPTPVAVQGLTNVVQVGAGYALTDNGAVYAWGPNDAGQLGNGNSGSGSNVPVAVTLPAGIPVQAIGGSMGGPARYAITGELTVNVDVVQDQIAAGSAGTVQAKVSSGSTGIGGAEVSLTATGNAVLGSTLGQTNGNGDLVTTVTPDQWTMPGAQVTVRASTDAAVSSDSFTVLGANVLGAGTGTWGGMGLHNDGWPVSVATPAQLDTIFPSPVVQMCANGYNSLALLADGTVWGVGQNGYNEVSGTDGQVARWQRIDGVSDAKQIALCDYSGHALLGDGSVVAWGTGGYGQLGDNSGYGTVWRTPTKINELSGVTQITVGFGTVYALMSDRTVKACGWNGLYQIGDGTTSDRLNFTTIPNLSNIVSLAPSSLYASALDSNGNVWNWGMGDHTPVQIPQLTGVKALASGIALMNDGTVAQLNGSATPVAVSGISNAVAVAGNVKGDDARMHTSYVILADGSVKAWGYNPNGQLGDGTTADQSSPVSVVGLGGRIVTGVFTGCRTNRAFFITGESTVTVDVADAQVAAGVASAVRAKVASGSKNVSGASITLSATDNAALGASTGATDTTGVFQTTVTPDLWTTPGEVVRVAAASGSSTAQDTFRVSGANAAGAGDWLGLGVEIGSVANSPTPVQLRREFTSPVVGMASNRNSGLALLKDGTVWGMGGNFYRTLADTDDAVYAWTQIPGVANAVQVAITDYTAYALRADGTVLAWGTGEYELFPPVNGQAAVWHTPTALGGLTGVKQIAAGFGTFYAVMSDGTVKVNGWGEVGQFGNGGTTNSSSFVTVPTLSGVQAIGTSAVAATALQSDGTVWYWGVGPNNTQIPPTKIPNLSGIKGVSSNVAVGGDGKVWQFDYANAATQVSGLSDVSSVASQGASFYALLPDGSVKSWGLNGAGQLGDGTKTDRTTPVDVTGLAGRVVTGVFPCIRGGKAHFVTGSGVVALTVATPIAAGSAGSVTAKIMAGSTPVAGAALALAATGGAVLATTSGQSDSSGQLQTTVTPDTWTRPGASLSVTAASGSSSATRRYVVLGANYFGTGTNYHANIGTGNWGAVSSPAQGARLFPSPVREISAGWWHAMALLQDGTVWTVGSNGYGMIGDGSNVSDRTTWTRVSLPGPVQQISSGWNHCVVLLTDGSVWTWGWNAYGALGNGTTTDSNVPIKVLTGVDLIEAGTLTTYVRKTDGTVWAWGQNSYGGQVGDGTTVDRLSPVQVQGLTAGTVVQLAGGGENVYALLNDGTVKAWGFNGSGQLGNGNTTNQSLPVSVSGLSNVIQLAGGRFAGYALLNDGTVRAWGKNEAGQLGNNSTTDSSVPVQVSGLSGVARISAAAQSAYVMMTDGTAQWWGGDDGYGPDTGNTPITKVPQVVSGLSGHIVSGLGSGARQSSHYFIV